MKQRWRSKTLGDLLKIQNGYAFDSKSFSATSGTPLIRIRDLKGGLNTETRYTGEYEEKYVVKSGDLLVGMDGEFGCYEWKGGKALLNQRVCRLQEFTSELQPKFLFYGLNSHLKAIEEVTGFTTVKHLSAKQITSINFSFPPLVEQKRIVAILDEAFEGIDTAIANARKNLANTSDILNVKLRDAVHPPGDEWPQKTLREISIDFGRGKSKHRPRGDVRLLGGDYPLIQTGDVANSDHFIVSYSRIGTKQALAKEYGLYSYRRSKCSRNCDPRFRSLFSG